MSGMPGLTAIHAHVNLVDSAGAALGVTREHVDARRQGLGVVLGWAMIDFTPVMGIGALLGPSGVSP